MKKSFNKNILVMVVILFLFAAFYHPSAKVEADANSVFYGVVVSSDHNVLSPNNVPFPFNVKKFGLDSMWSASDNTKIIIPQDGVYEMNLAMTALGLIYGGPTSERTIYEVVANWCGNEAVCKHLDSDVAFERFEVQNQYAANGNTLNWIAYFTKGTVLQVLTTGKDSRGLLIESNPFNLGTLSPRWGVWYVGSLP